MSYIVCKEAVLTLRYDPKYLVTWGESHCERTVISCCMSSISSSASSRSIIFIATTFLERLSNLFVCVSVCMCVCVYVCVWCVCVCVYVCV